MSQILPLAGFDPKDIATAKPLKSSAQEVGQGFVDVFKDAFYKVNDMQVGADHGMEDLAVGRTQNLHEVMIKVEEAGVAFQMLMAVRGKLMNAYQEVMRMHF